MSKTKIAEMSESIEEVTTDVAAPETQEEVVEATEAVAEEKAEEKKAPQKPGKRTKIRSKKYQESSEKVHRADAYGVDEAINLAKEVSYAKFGGSLEIHINTSAKSVRGLVSLPFASGKTLRVVAFGKGAEESGADQIGDDDKLKEIEKGKIDFDVLIADPTWMPKLARAAKVLGPKGLMPNPKNGTVTTDLKKAVAEVQSGKVEYKTESKANVIHLSLGKISQPNEELIQNTRTLLLTIGKTKIKKAVIAPTMGIGIKLDLSSL